MKLLPAIMLFLCLATNAQNETLLNPGRVVFYNLENFFDTIKDPENSDEAFLPKSQKQWNTEKYQTKLSHISHVLAVMFDSIQPIVIGLAEVENRKVVEDLIAQPELKQFNLGIEHHDSPGPHGLDVALVYNKDVIQEVFSTFLPVKFSFDSTDTVRDILYFKGFMTEEFPVYFFINHWPSNQEEKGDAEKKRLTVAMQLRAKIENIYLGEPAARIVLMGDFNDNPDGKSIEYLSQGRNKYPQTEDLINLMRLLQVRGEFTNKTGEKSEIYDQMIVSKNLMTSDNLYYICSSAAHIFKPLWLLKQEVPFATYAGSKWLGGYSNHLPVYLDLCFH
jgi:Endonuclease/Exonuclease/phosphatase family